MKTNYNLKRYWNYNKNDSSSGVFTLLYNLGGSAFGLTESNSKDLDRLYFLARSGDKTPSVLLDSYNVYEEEDEQLLAVDATFAKVNTLTLQTYVKVSDSLSIERLLSMKEYVSNMIYTKFSYNWTKLYEAFTTDYAPLENYSMTENETGSGSERGSNNVTLTDSTTDNRTITGTDTQTINLKDVSENDTTTSVNTNMTTLVDIDSTTSNATDTTTTTNTDNSTYGYNSSTEVPTTSQDVTMNVSGSGDSNKSIVDGTTTTTQSGSSDTNKTIVDGTNTITKTGTDTHQTSTTDNRTNNGTHTTVGEDSKINSNTRQLTRSGNIGVTTSQQMLESEIELRKWSLFESYMSDIDTILTRRLYC